MAGGDRLEQLFDLYSSDLTSCVTELRDAFGCPLCYRIIPKAQDLREIVVEEHIIAEAL